MREKILLLSVLTVAFCLFAMAIVSFFNGERNFTLIYVALSMILLEVNIKK